MEGFVGWVQESLFLWLRAAGAICIALWVVVLLPMFLLKKRREWVGVGLIYSSYLLGFTWWVFSFIVTYRTLGAAWLLIGVFTGLGVIPLAVVGILVRGLWTAVPDLIFAVAITFLPKALGFWIMKREEHAAKRDLLANFPQGVG